jgi:hypothetical protein
VETELGMYSVIPSHTWAVHRCSATGYNSYRHTEYIHTLNIQCIEHTSGEEESWRVIVEFSV